MAGGVNISRTVVIALVVGLSVTATPLVGQGYHREGFWFGGGLGGGSTTGEDSGNEIGPAVYFRAGGTLSRGFLMGGDLFGWYWKSGDDELLRSSVSLAMILYPLDSANLLIRGTAGFAHSETRRSSPVGMGLREVDYEDGVSLGIGVGYDIRLSESFSLTPNVDLVGYNFGGFNSGLAVLTIGMTWH